MANENNATTNISVPDNVATALAAGAELARLSDRTGAIDDVPYVLVPKGMQVHVLKDVVELADNRADAPRARVGLAKHDELESFIAHLNRFKDPDSVVFADIAKVQLLAVFDYHPAGPAEEKGARWGRHRSVYGCPLSRQWKLWTSVNEKVFTQDQFGEFIDANLADLANPAAGGPVSTDIAAPAALVEMARNLIVRTKGEFSRQINPTTGESSLVSKTENESQSTKIPRAFLLGIPVFEGGELYAVEARVRFAMRDGRPSFAFSLYQPDVVLRDAFNAVRTRVAEATKLPVFAGSPEV